jgi:hypothetical protein
VFEKNKTMKNNEKYGFKVVYADTDGFFVTLENENERIKHVKISQKFCKPAELCSAAAKTMFLQACRTSFYASKNYVFATFAFSTPN